MQQLPRKVLRKQQERRLFVKKMKRNVAVTTSTVALAGFSLSLLTPKKVAASNSGTIFKATNEQDFIRQIAAYASKCAANNDLYASVMIAQAILESGWGSSALSVSPNHNLFGIKGAYNGQSVSMNTSEYLNGQWVTRYEAFRKYPSYYESFQDNANVLKNTSFSAGKYYYAGAWKSNTTSYRQATAYLTGRYATDPGYAGKLNTIIERYGLTAYDTPSTGGNQGVETPEVTPSAPSTASTYTVKAGDSLWGISRKVGLSLTELLNLNQITVNHVIHPGDQLVIQKGAVSIPETKPEVTPTPTPETSTPSTPATPNTPTTSTYTVKAGDSLWGISRKVGLSLTELLNLNQITVNHVIHPGDKLVIQKGATTTPAPAPITPEVTPSTPSTSTATYKVQKGDTLWRISQKHGLSVSQLKVLNQLTSDTIYVGQTLKLK